MKVIWEQQAAILDLKFREKYEHMWSILTICDSHIWKFTYLLKLVSNWKIDIFSTLATFGGHTQRSKKSLHMTPAEVEQGPTPALCISFQTVDKCSSCWLFSAQLFPILYFFCYFILFKMGPKIIIKVHVWYALRRKHMSWKPLDEMISIILWTPWFSSLSMTWALSIT